MDQNHTDTALHETTYTVPVACYREAGRAVGALALGVGVEGGVDTDGRPHVTVRRFGLRDFGDGDRGDIADRCAEVAELRVQPGDVLDWADSDGLDRRALALMFTHWSAVEDVAQFLAGCDRATLIDSEIFMEIWTGLQLAERGQVSPRDVQHRAAGNVQGNELSA